MELRSPVPTMSPAEWLADHVKNVMSIAVDVALTRSQDPTKYPIFPPGADHLFFARRLLGAMADAGIRPEGWEEAFFLGDS